MKMRDLPQGIVVVFLCKGTFYASTSRCSGVPVKWNPEKTCWQHADRSAYCNCVFTGQEEVQIVDNGTTIRPDF
jgi:hypothetical protein